MSEESQTTGKQTGDEDLDEFNALAVQQRLDGLPGVSAWLATDGQQWAVIACESDGEDTWLVRQSDVAAFEARQCYFAAPLTEFGERPWATPVFYDAAPLAPGTAAYDEAVQFEEVRRVLAEETAVLTLTESVLDDGAWPDEEVHETERVTVVLTMRGVPHIYRNVRAYAGERGRYVRDDDKLLL